MSDSLLERILEPGGLRAVFQPIFEVGVKARAADAARLPIHAVECLVRGPAGTNVESPDVLFEYARRKRAEGTVDRACAAAVLQEAAHLPGEPRVCLNVHASTLARDHEFGVFIGDVASSRGVSIDRITFEIVEHTLPGDAPSFLNALAGLRAVGASITLDHVGSGHSNYRMMLECRPNYFKVDDHFVHGAHTDFAREAVLESVVRLASRLGGRVIALGVEDDADLVAATRAGIDLVQGRALCGAVELERIAPFLEGRPAPQASEPPPA